MSTVLSGGGTVAKPQKGQFSKSSIPAACISSSCFFWTIRENTVDFNTVCVTGYDQQLVTNYKQNVHTQRTRRQTVTPSPKFLYSLQLKCSGSCQVRVKRIKLSLCIYIHHEDMHETRGTDPLSTRWRYTIHITPFPLYLTCGGGGGAFLCALL
jgi:hypothetical protein